MAPTLDIVIVNWNAGAQLRACLDSIRSSQPGDYVLDRVIVADNGSIDGSADGLDDLGLPLTVLRNGANLGFAVACNRAAALGRARFVLFLNPDTRLDPDTLALSVAELAAQPDTGILGVRLTDGSGAVQRTCARFPRVRHFVFKVLGLDRWLPGVFLGHLMLEWDHRTSRTVDQVMGAYFLMPRWLFERLDGFDERFFLYFEDVDFAWRARRLGYPCRYFADASAYHKGGGTSEQVRPERVFYCLRSRMIYARKHFGWWRAAALAALTVTVEPFSRLALALAAGSRARVAETLRAYAHLAADLPQILSMPARDHADPTPTDAPVAAQPIRPAQRH